MSEEETFAAIPADDLARMLVLAKPMTDESLVHVGIVGDTYTILLSGKDTAGRLALFDMHIPAGGGPGPHRHDFEETFLVLEGELEANFRGEKKVVKAGETVHIPANAPHQFHNSSGRVTRTLCICSPAGQEDFFLELGVRVATRTEAPPELSEAEKKAFLAKAMEIAARYRTELLKGVPGVVLGG